MKFSDIQLKVWALKHLPVLPKARRNYQIDHLKRCMRMPQPLESHFYE